MKYTQSEVIDTILRYFQMKQDAQAPAIEIVRSKYPYAELTTKELKPYTSWLDQQVMKKNISVTTGSGDPFSTKIYYLQDFQKQYWQAKNWSER